MATADPFANLRAQHAVAVAALNEFGASAHQAASALKGLGAAARAVEAETQAELRLASKRSGLLRRFKQRAQVIALVP